jgi:putative FmdB family regulatory protein
MPTYEYACKNCGEHVEVVQSFRDDPLTECPACGGPLRKVFAPVGIVLKGSGFYKTDSRAAARRAGKKKEPAGESAGSSSSAESSSSSAESSSSSAESSSSTESSKKSESKPKSEKSA